MVKMVRMEKIKDENVEIVENVEKVMNVDCIVV